MKRDRSVASGSPIDGGGRYLDIPLACPKNRERYSSTARLRVQQRLQAAPRFRARLPGRPLGALGRDVVKAMSGILNAPTRWVEFTIENGQIQQSRRHGLDTLYQGKHSLARRNPR